MSNDSIKETLAKEASEDIDFDEVIRKGNLGEGVDAKDMGAAIGRWLGKRLGRSFGESVGMNVHEVLSGKRSPPKVVNNAKKSVSKTVREQARKGRSLVQSGRQRVEEGEKRVEKEASKATDELSREALEAMPIAELESVAREAGVKVDVGREEMTKRILETVDGGKESGSGGNADHQTGNTGSNG